MNDEYFMLEAIKEAETASKNGNWPIGCVVVLDGKVIARSHNKVYSRNSKIAHAEMLALDQVQDILNLNRNRAVLYTTCEPCPMCFGAIILSKVSRIVYGIMENGGATKLKEYLPPVFKQKKFEVKITPGVLADECWQLFLDGKPTKKQIENGLLLSEYKKA